MTESLFITDLRTGQRYALPACSLDTLETPGGAEEVALLGGGSMLVAEAGWDKGRTLKPPKWTLRFAMSGRDQMGVSGPRLKGLLLSWMNGLAPLMLEGPDLLHLVDEPLTRLSNTVYAGALGWWDGGFAITVDGVAQTDGVTVGVDPHTGVVTLVTSIDTDAVVLCSASRVPRVRVLSVTTGPVSGTSPVRYESQVTLREDMP